MVIREKLDISLLTISYIKALSQKKIYNIQSISLKNLFFYSSDKSIKQELDKNVHNFFKHNEIILARDFLFKNDSFTPRSMYLISPIYYAYYTKLVFNVSLKLKRHDTEIVNFSTNHMETFYSGILEFTNHKDKIDNNAIFNKSYNLFRQEREKYFDKHVIKVDIKDFFNSISTKILINKLKNRIGECYEVTELEKFFLYCDFNTLPQFHYSIASSLLSQIYLLDFDEKLSLLLQENKLNLIRFVDDMYIYKKSGEYKLNEVNNLVDNINSLLWFDGLVLNSSKTKLLKPEQNEESFKLIDIVSMNETSYSSEKLIDDKANEVINSGGLVEFISILNEMYKKDGIYIQEYLKLLDKYLSVNGGDSNKVLSNIIFTEKWKRLNYRDLLLISKKWNYIFFNPSQFTVLYILVNRYLENKKIVDGSNIKRVLSYMYKKDQLKFRDSMVVIGYLFQNRKKNKNLLKKVEYLNKDYVDFINKYLKKL
ncbi:reverse transcriptase domain-containing protein [Paenisporosarcina cavernae]|uniref:Reverse transcriptase domain-containing protein n=1 Tax=Paenisporosarcina cavernae TaxID=2320858 RepID=A0A385YSJ5_9BACL|nr:reverse transcriptase domain-containing protein [Paenisporosarcina cavernae]AYC28413.1 hypothetical protein D3873_00455 [Paenisporosarcina cavernae]